VKQKQIELIKNKIVKLRKSLSNETFWIKKPHKRKKYVF